MNILITGANRGLGFGFVQHYLQSGNNVLASCREPSAAKELSALSKENSKSLQIIKMDMRDLESIRSSSERLASSISHLDLLILNAGRYGQKGGNSINAIDEDEIMQSFIVNTMGPLRVSRSLFPLLCKARSPKLITITSLMGSIEDNTSGGSYDYRLSKAALNMLTKNLAIELRAIGGTAVMLHPGWVKTDMGGPNARIDIPTSIRGMTSVIERLGPEDNGKFFSYEGNLCPF